MAYIESTNIKVFPCGGRNIQYDPLARLTTEQNLISIINKLIDKDGFIISTYPANTNISNINLEYMFNINGYLFTIKGGPKAIIDTLVNDGLLNNAASNFAPIVDDNIYINASINIYNYNKYAQLAPLESIKSSDSYTDTILDTGGNIFIGVKFELSNIADTIVENKNIDATTYSLTLFEYKHDLNHWVEYENSKIKFKTDEDHRSISIDDGVLG